MTTPAGGDVRTRPVRVAIVDDIEDLRVLMRLQFVMDPRFEVVGEAADGREAIALAEAEQPDLMILDVQMPGLSGLEATPEIHRRSPDTAIVLYTAQTDARTVQAALAEGALHVLEKAAPGRAFIDRLVGVLVDRATEDAAIEVRVGPVSAQAARAWVANTTRIIDAVAARPDVLDEPLPDDVVELFRSFLRQWDAVASTTDEFHWVAWASPTDVQRIVGHWAAIDRMTDEQLDRLGIRWSPPEGQPFFQALTTGVLEALHRHDETRRLAERLSEQWAPYLEA